MIDATFFDRWGKLFQAFILVAVGWWVFSPALSGDWLWDDAVFLSRAPTDYDSNGLWKIWFQPGQYIEYYPVEQSLQWLQWQLWHKVTFGYHLTNIVLHMIGGLLLWRLLAKLGIRLAWLGGLLFVVHPVVVESVSYIFEFKNTLSLPLFLMALCAWVDYKEKGRNGDYWRALVLFVFALLCKITLLLFPIVILLFAWWKNGRLGWNDFKDSAPFFIVSALLGSLVIYASSRYAQIHGLEADPPIGGLLSRFVCVGLSLSFYLKNCLYPATLMPFYPKWSTAPDSVLQFSPWVVIALLLCLCWIRRAQEGRHVLLGLGFFVVMLVPVLGFRSISFMRFTWVMDHLAYVPLIGIIGLGVVGLDWLGNRLPGFVRPGIGWLGLGMAGALALQSHAYAGKFIDQETLWTYTIEHNPNAWLAYTNLGNAMLQKGWVTQAAEDYRKALKMNPSSALAHNNMGVAQEQLGKLKEARAEYEQALKIAPGYPDAKNNLTRLTGNPGDSP